MVTQRASLAKAVVMVPPRAFQFNAETGQDNEFQQRLALDDDALKATVMTEFQAMSDKLRQLGVDVIVFDNGRADTPDAVFPNNWFATDKRGHLFIFPMLCANRQREVMPEQLSQTLSDSGYDVRQVVDLRDGSHIFEGTGALIIDHLQNVGYCALSHRADRQLLPKVEVALGLDAIHYFETCSSSGGAVYHSNVLMSVGPEYAIVCTEVVLPAHRTALMDKLKDKVVIEITEAQMQNFCGNVLQIGDKHGNSHIVMSSSAYSAFRAEQLAQLAQFGEIQHFNVSVIEQVGGGSVRCMLAEVFLPAA
ncbi:MAG: arginine deiminase-related protein [Aestuariibacter sp.]